MISLTINGRKTLLILFKDFTSYYNANSLSKKLGMSRVGTMKILKKLYKENLLIKEEIGKSIIYKAKLDDDYVTKLIAFLLADEANKFKRWKEEFKDLAKKDRIIMIYGSAIKNYATASDIDIMLIIDNKEISEVNKSLRKIEEILPKKLHAIKLERKDLVKNLRNKQKAIVDIVRNAIVLYGHDKYVEIIKNVTSF